MVISIYNCSMKWPGCVPVCVFNDLRALSELKELFYSLSLCQWVLQIFIALSWSLTLTFKGCFAIDVLFRCHETLCYILVTLFGLNDIIL